MSNLRVQYLFTACSTLYTIGFLFAPLALAQTATIILPGSGGGSLQTGASGLGPSQNVSTPASPNVFVSGIPPLSTGEGSLIPKLFGLRPWLTDHGIGVVVDSFNDFQGTIAGGGGPPTNASSTTNGGVGVVGQVAFETDINWETLAGIRGFSTHDTLLGAYGSKPVNQDVGDNLNPTQANFGARGNVVVHFVEGYGEETLAGGRFDATFGRIPLDDDFFSSPLYCNFENNDICGNPKTGNDNIYHSSYPDSVWAFRIRVRPLPDYYIQSGIFFGQDNIYSATKDFRTGFDVDASYINGETFPVEIGWEPAFGSQHLRGHYKLGFIYDNNHHADDYYDINGAPYVLSGLPPRQRTGSTSTYALVDQMVYRLGAGANDGVILLGGYYHNDPETSVRANQVFGGAIATNFWRLRPMDTISFLYTYQNLSNLIKKTQELQLEQGIDPLDGGLVNGASGVQDADQVIELNYAIHVYRGITFAPDFQYFVHPNAQTNLRNAAFLGFKSHFVLF